MGKVTLPDGWIIVLLPEVVFFQEGPGLRKFQYTDTGIPFLNIRTIKEGIIDKSICQHLSLEEVEQKYNHFLLNEGDIVCSTSGTIGKTAVVMQEDTPLMLNTSIVRFRELVKGTIERNYIHAFLKSNNFISQTEKNATGTAQKNIGPSHLKEFDFLLPPLAEQKVIADKLDTLLAQVETTKVRLERIPNILKRFRQSVLAAAVSGKLTEEWRTSIPISNSELNKLPENKKTRRGLPDHVVISDSLIEFTFPEYWDVLSVASLLRKGVIIDLKDGNHGANHPKSSEFTELGLPFITAAQMSDHGKIDYTGAPKISGKPLEKLNVGFSEPDDVIYSHKGTVGRVGIADRKSVLSPQTTYIRLNKKYISNHYYAIMLKSNAFTAQVDAIKSQTTRDFVPITAHYSLYAVIPPMNEQTEIVRRVEELFTLADAIEQKSNSALERVNNLTQSILAKAFRGELTADWRAANPELISGDNSAEALLARIKIEREALKPKKAVKKKSPKRKRA